MPALSKPTKRIYLPSTENDPVEDNRIYVDVKTKLSLAESYAAKEGDNPIAIALNSLAVFIVDWNVTDDLGNKVPIDVKTVGDIDEDDAVPILDHMTLVFKKASSGLDTDLKKTSFDTVTPPSTDVSQTSTSLPSTELTT